MKKRQFALPVLTLIILVMGSCYSDIKKGILAQEGEYTLTIHHLRRHWVKVKAVNDTLTIEDMIIERDKLLDHFHDSPQTTLDNLNGAMGSKIQLGAYSSSSTLQSYSRGLTVENQNTKMGELFSDGPPVILIGNTLNSDDASSGNLRFHDSDDNESKPRKEIIEK